jgi:HK97 family phage prohead protease
MMKRAYFKSEFKTRAGDDGGKYIEGYFVVFNQRAEIWKGWFEEIAPEAVVSSLTNNDIRCLFNHNRDIVLGRTGIGTLVLTPDKHGLFGSVRVNEEDKQAMDVYARVKRGDIDGCSFGFNPTREDFKVIDEGTLDRILDMDMPEVSVCPFPAYPQTEISARKKEYDDNITEKRAAMREDIKIRIQKLKK